MLAILALVAVLAATELTAPATGSDHPGPAPEGAVIVNPDWVRKPTQSEVAQYYPEVAALYGIDGRVVLRCAVAVTGLLEGCSVTEETPPDMGFGAAALDMTEKMRMSPQTYNGVPHGGTMVNVPLAFKAPHDNLPGLTESLACYGRLTAHERRGDTDPRLAQVATMARKRAMWLMKIKRIPVPTRAKRLESSVKAARLPAGADEKVERCLKAFLS